MDSSSKTYHTKENVILIVPRLNRNNKLDLESISTLDAAKILVLVLEDLRQSTLRSTLSSEAWKNRTQIITLVGSVRLKKFAFHLNNNPYDRNRIKH